MTETLDDPLSDIQQDIGVDGSPSCGGDLREKRKVIRGLGWGALAVSSVTPIGASTMLLILSAKLSGHSFLNVEKGGFIRRMWAVPTMLLGMVSGASGLYFMGALVVTQCHPHTPDYFGSAFVSSAKADLSGGSMPRLSIVADNYDMFNWWRPIPLDLKLEAAAGYTGPYVHKAVLSDALSANENCLFLSAYYQGREVAKDKLCTRPEVDNKAVPKPSVLANP